MPEPSSSTNRAASREDSVSQRACTEGQRNPKDAEQKTSIEFRVIEQEAPRAGGRELTDNRGDHETPGLADLPGNVPGSDLFETGLRQPGDIFIMSRETGQTTLPTNRAEQHGDFPTPRPGGRQPGTDSDSTSRAELGHGPSEKAGFICKMLTALDREENVVRLSRDWLIHPIAEDVAAASP